MEPVRERIVWLDAVRGVALFGILMVNVTVFSGPYPLSHHDPWTSARDRFAYGLVDAAFANKFFPTFSFLFGLGFGIQLERAAQSAGNDRSSFARFWRRRMGALFAFGIVHAALLSTIDILVQYAILGMLLYAVRRMRDRTLATLASALLAVPVALMALAIRSGESGFTGYSPSHAARMIAGYAHGTFTDFERIRIADLRDYYLWVAYFAGWPITAMFLTGYIAARRGIIQAVAMHRERIRRVFVVAVIVGITASAARIALDHDLYRAPSVRPQRWIVHAALQMLGDPALSLTYVTGLALAFSRPAMNGVARVFAALGRNALTNYVAQSIAMNLAFFATRTYGAVRPSTALAIGVCIYLAQLVAAQWTRRAGPLERLWRRWTYA
jgi:uncharacterized protein